MQLYEKVLAETRLFLADQSEPFLHRQCKHLRISLDALTSQDLPKLAYWVRVSASLVMSQDKADLLAEKISSLSE